MQPTAQKAEPKTESRSEDRHGESQLLFPVSMVVKLEDREIVVEVVNYHHKGACLRFSDVPAGLLEKLEAGKVAMDFFLGKRRLRGNVPFRLAWQSLAQDKTIGVEFLATSTEFVPRPTRFAVHTEFPPQVSAMDPMDPNRTVFFRVQNVSENGMLLLSSLANKHLLPGLILRNAQLTIPGQATITVSLFLVNTRRSETPGMFEIGASVEGNKSDYVAQVRRYISFLSPMEESERRNGEGEPVVLTKHLKHGTSYRVVTKPEDYAKVLKLRYAAYLSHSKVRTGSQWSDQGEGLAQEGTILAGFVGSQLLSTVELRFSDGPVPFRICKYFPDGKLPFSLQRRTVEINKLSVHPNAQGTDMFVGVYQRIHSILVQRGGYDVLIAATDKLAPLYLRLGFNKTGVTIPHPYLAGQNLNLLILPMQYYLEARQINPAAWVAVYENTQRYLESVGIARPLQRSLRYRILRAVGVLLQPFLRRKSGKKTAAGDRAPAKENTFSNPFVDPKWTSQHIIAPIMKPYVLEADAMIGTEKVDAILSRIGVPRTFFNRQANWLSVAFLDEFIDQFSTHGDIAELSRRSGERALQRDQIGVKYFFLKHFVTPEQTFRATEKILPKFNQSRSYELLEVSRSHAKFAIGVQPGYPLPKHRQSCLNWQTNLEAYFKIMAGTVGQVTKLTCCYDGDETCTYDLRWTQSRRILPALAAGLIGTGVLTGVAVMVWPWIRHFPLSTIALSIFGGGSFAAAVREIFLHRRDSKNFDHEFERLEQEGSEKYSELQQAKTTLDERYREARLLEDTAKKIQASNELTDILKVSLDAICKHFGFDRAFVMLADEGRKMLRTSAVACIKEGVEELWGFQVDVSQLRPNSIFVSSVFHTGNPVLIDNVDTHFFQFNEPSQKLIKKLGTRGFIMVPIPSENSRWGVLIADKTSPNKNLSRTDLTLLQRVAQHLGISLDKQAKLDHERGVRQLFQKYAPPELINQVRPGQTAALGGQMRQIAALFLDIREFTRLSETLPPQATLDILNQVFTMVQEVVSKHGGWIDKFLGDGALITWGAVGAPIDGCTNAVTAALEIPAKLEEVNRRLIANGLNAIRIGLGLNFGPAIVGNVGAESRMEFTSIGGTLNVASRLEGLTKELKATLVVSESVLNALPATLRQKFKEVPGVQIRGIAHPITVGAFVHE